MFQQQKTENENLFGSFVDRNCVKVSKNLKFSTFANAWLSVVVDSSLRLKSSIGIYVQIGGKGGRLKITARRCKRTRPVGVQTERLFVLFDFEASNVQHGWSTSR